MLKKVAALVLLTAACGGEAVVTTRAPAETMPPPPTVTSAGDTSTTTGCRRLGPADTCLDRLPPPPDMGTWTVILESLDVAGFSLPDALQRASTFPGSAVLWSDEFPSLNPGYWVVHTGSFTDMETAAERCRELRASAISCYQRYLGESAGTTGGGSAVAPIRANGRAIGFFDTDLAVVELDAGALERVVSSRYEGGIFPYDAVLSPDAATVYFSAGFEDFWFSCSASAGQVTAVDVASGAEQFNLRGGFATLSPDGELLAKTDATTCIPDPEQPEIWVLSFSDTIVARNLTTGAESRWGPPPGLSATPDSEVFSLAWSQDGTKLYYRLGEEPHLRVLEVDRGSVTTDGTIVEADELDAAAFWKLVGFRAGTGRLVVIERSGDPGAGVPTASRLVELDPATGSTTVIATYSSYIDASFDTPQRHLLIVDAGRLRDESGAYLGTAGYVGTADW